MTSPSLELANKALALATEALRLESRDGQFPSGAVGSQGNPLPVVFLSHSGVDKPLVRPFKKPLQAMGFAPWLDEDEVAAGDVPNRRIVDAFRRSCAAVFFITRNFADDRYIQGEIDYAIEEQRQRPDTFRIVALVMGDARTCDIPAPLRRFAWKEPRSGLEALNDIVDALCQRVHSHAHASGNGGAEAGPAKRPRRKRPAAYRIPRRSQAPCEETVEDEVLSSR